MATLGLLGMQIWTQGLRMLVIGIISSGLIYLLSIALFGWRQLNKEVHSLLRK